MPFPAGLPLVTVNVQIDTLPSGGATGFVRIVYTGTLTGPTDDSIVPFVDEKRTLAADGSATVQVPPTNHPNWTPQDFQYAVWIGTGRAVHEGRLSLDYQTLSVELADVIEWTAADVDPGVTYATLAQLTAGLAGKANTVHTHIVGDVTGLTTALNTLTTAVDGKAPLVHTHAQADVTGLTAALAGKAPTVHTHVQSDVTGLAATLADKADLVGGFVPTAQIPALAVTEYLGPTANQAAMLALTGQQSDWTIRTDLGTVWVITGADPTQLASWTQLAYPTAPVTSVNSQTGVVVLGKADVGLPNVTNTSDVDKPVSTAQQAALDLKLDETGGTISGTLSLPSAPALLLGGVPTQANERLATNGEYVQRRKDCNTVTPITSGSIFVSHFVALKTETILTLQTNTQGAGLVGVGGTSSWIGIMSWDGTQYLPLAVSADLATRWNTTFTEYNTAIYAPSPGTGLANLASPGWSKVAGTRYALWMIWNGSGTAPSLPCCSQNFADALTEPRDAGFMALAAPPSSAIMAGWLSALGRSYQAWMRPA